MTGFDLIEFDWSKIHVTLIQNFLYLLKGEREIISYTLLQNIRVLAIDQTVEEQDGEHVVVGKTATLELDPSQVETIAAAEEAGSLSLSLRSVEDADDIQLSKRKRSGIIKVYRAGRSNLVKTQ